MAVCADRGTPVVCYPRSVDSVAFYLGRDDFLTYRSKETPALVNFLRSKPRVAILFSHRHSLEQLTQVLPPDLKVVMSAPLGLCSMALVERRTAIGAQASLKPDRPPGRNRPSAPFALTLD
jgi:hypothetical protein